MKSYKGVLLYILLAVFALTSIAGAGPPVNLKGPPAVKQPGPAINKNILKQIPEADPGLAIIGLQSRHTQEVSALEYQVKIKNQSSTPYAGHARLGIYLKMHDPTKPDKFRWDTAEAGKEIGPLAPGEEKTIAGRVVRTGYAVGIKAAVKGKDKEWASRTSTLPDMPAPDVKIKNISVANGSVRIDMENHSNYKIDDHAGLGVQVLKGTSQADGSVDFAPAGGFLVKLEPYQQNTQTMTLTPGHDVYKARLYYSRPTLVVVDEKIFWP